MTTPLTRCTRRQAVTRTVGLLVAPWVAGCWRDLPFAPEAPVLSRSDDGSYTLCVVSDPHNHRRLANGCRATGALLESYPGLPIYNLGDNAGVDGTEAEFDYTEQTWGRFADRLWSSLGNHDIKADPTGAPYFNYYGAAAGERGKGYYANDYGTWRVYVLNSEYRTAEQLAWLTADLKAHAHRHLIAMWHKPAYLSPGKVVGVPGQVRPFWKALQAHGAEIICNGHSHRYERFQRLLPGGTASPDGIRQFVAGTGGGILMPLDGSPHPMSESQVVAFGVLRLTLHANSYEWAFVDTAGVSRDSGSELCRKVVASV